MGYGSRSGPAARWLRRGRSPRAPNGSGLDGVIRRPDARMRSPSIVIATFVRYVPERTSSSRPTRTTTLRTGASLEVVCASAYRGRNEHDDDARTRWRRVVTAKNGPQSLPLTKDLASSPRSGMGCRLSRLGDSPGSRLLVVFPGSGASKICRQVLRARGRSLAFLPVCRSSLRRLHRDEQPAFRGRVVPAGAAARSMLLALKRVPEVHGSSFAATGRDNARSRPTRRSWRSSSRTRRFQGGDSRSDALWYDFFNEDRLAAGLLAGDARDFLFQDGRDVLP
jgi:hypothetical protein